MNPANIPRVLKDYAAQAATLSASSSSTSIPVTISTSASQHQAVSAIPVLPRRDAAPPPPSFMAAKPVPASAVAVKVEPGAASTGSTFHFDLTSSTTPANVVTAARPVPFQFNLNGDSDSKNHSYVPAHPVFPNYTANSDSQPPVKLEFPASTASGFGGSTAARSFSSYSKSIKSAPGKTSKYRHSSPASSSSGDSPSSRRSVPYSPSDLKVRRKMRKNCREKQRRQELNDKFERLCLVLNLSRKSKTEKFTILTEAINQITALRSEAEELRRERVELKTELGKVTTALKNAFPSQPDVLPLSPGGMSPSPTGEAARSPFSNYHADASGAPRPGRMGSGHSLASSHSYRDEEERTHVRGASRGFETSASGFYSRGFDGPSGHRTQSGGTISAFPSSTPAAYTATPMAPSPTPLSSSQAPVSGPSAGPSSSTLHPPSAFGAPLFQPGRRLSQILLNQNLQTELSAFANRSVSPLPPPEDSFRIGSLPGNPRMFDVSGDVDMDGDMLHNNFSAPY